jgi:hypothetical protein
MTYALGFVAIALSTLSAIAGLKAVSLANRSAVASEKSASVALATDRRAREPRLEILLNQAEPAPNERVIYRVKNLGPQSLDSIVAYRPRPANQIKYPITKTGALTGWADDEVELGPIDFTQEARFTLCCGAAEDLPEFDVRFVCRSGDDEWEIMRNLPPPRPSKDLPSPTGK